LIKNIEAGFDTVGNEIEAVHLRAALQEVVRLASEVNKYLDTTAPWTAIKTDKEAAARAVFIAIKAIDSLKVLFAPFIPFTSERLNQFLGYEYPLFGSQSVTKQLDSLDTHTVLRYHPETGKGEWKPSNLQPGAIFLKPEPMFKKLDPSIVEEERARLGK
jgi:methionyl-tRNA synthetase